MADLHDLLERTTPSQHDLPPLDMGELQRGAWRETLVRRAGGALVAVVVGVAGLGVLGTFDTSEDPDVVVRPAGEVEPLGDWTDLGAWPLGPRHGVEGRVLDDGRLLFLGGRAEVDGVGGEVDGAIYDPVAQQWELVPPAPLRPSWLRVLPVETGPTVLVSDGEAAVLDTDALIWSKLPGLPDGRTLPRDLRRWTADAGVVGVVLPDQQGFDVELWRWDGAEWKLRSVDIPARPNASIASAPGRLAVHGGDGRRDGVAWDVVQDRVDVLGDPGLMSQAPALAWVGERALSFISDDRSVANVLDLGAGTIESTGRMPSPGWTIAAAGMDHLGEATLVARDQQESAPATTFMAPASVYDERAGEFIRALDPGGFGVWAVPGGWWLESSANANPGDQPFGVAFLDRDGGFHHAGAAPFPNLLDAAVVVGEHDLWILGGMAGPELDVTDRLWHFERR